MRKNRSCGRSGGISGRILKKPFGRIINKTYRCIKIFIHFAVKYSFDDSYAEKQQKSNQISRFLRAAIHSNSKMRKFWTHSST